MLRWSIFIVADMYGQVVLITCLVLNGFGIFSAVLAILAIRVVILFILFFLVKSQIGIRRPHFSKMREYLTFGLPTVLGNKSNWAVAFSDRFVISYFLGVTSVGVYSAGYLLGSAPLWFAAVLGYVLTPTLSKLYDEGRMNELKTHLSYSVKYSFAIDIPFVLGAVILAEPVLRLFSTAEIASEAYYILPLVALSMLLFAVYPAIYNILVLVKKTKTIAAIWIVCVSVNLGLTILVVPQLGISGAAITTIIAYGLASGLTTYYSFKELRFAIDWSFITKSLIASAIMALAIWLMSPQGTSDTIIVIAAGAAIYAVALLLLKGFKKEEFNFFKKLFQRG